MAVIGEHLERIAELKRELTEFNLALFASVLEAARDDRELAPGLAREVEEQYASAMSAIQSNQLRMGMALRRLGVRPFDRPRANRELQRAS
jgi:hypothetical protein